MDELRSCIDRVQILCETAQALLSHDLKVAVRQDKSNRKPKHQTLAEMAYFEGAQRAVDIFRRVSAGQDALKALEDLPLEPPSYSLKRAGRE
jgi:hypothetical protein